MSEEKKTVYDPITRQRLAETLRKIGVRSDQIIEVHARLSSFDWLIGGAQTIVDTLMEIAGETGTIMMPMHHIGNSEPSDWENPPVAPSLYRLVRDAIPPYNPEINDITGMGDVAENFRRRPGVLISHHPEVSYAAWGRYAKLLCNHQSYHFPLAEESPAARLYEMKGNVLLIGCDFDTATCLHLAEYKTDSRMISIHGSSMPTENGREWRKYLDLEVDSSAFMKVKTIMQRKNMINEVTLGGSLIQYFSASEAIDEAIDYFEKSTVYELYR